MLQKGDYYALDYCEKGHHYRQIAHISKAGREWDTTPDPYVTCKCGHSDDDHFPTDDRSCGAIYTYGSWDLTCNCKSYVPSRTCSCGK